VDCFAAGPGVLLMQTRSNTLHYGRLQARRLASPPGVWLLTFVAAGSDMLATDPILHGAPAPVLMGCSTARLSSVATGDERTTSAVSGPLANFLSIGSPCVVANLWDVTDRDIDRFTAAMLSQCAPPAVMTALCTTV
jgi:hypothetical protein